MSANRDCLVGDPRGESRRRVHCMNSVVDTHFKGWAKPGPVAPGHLAGMTPEPDETLDAISGHFRLFQLRDGHRFSTDDILTTLETVPMPLPRSSAVEAVGHHEVPYQPVRMSSVENR